MKQSFKPIPKPRQGKTYNKRMQIEKNVPAAARIKYGIIICNKQAWKKIKSDI